MSNKEIKFSDYKPRILEAINERASNFRCNCGSQNMTLIDGFVSQSLHKEVTGAVVIGGPTVPMVMLVCKNCGHVHYFALKALLPDLEL